MTLSFHTDRLRVSLVSLESKAEIVQTVDLLHEVDSDPKVMTYFNGGIPNPREYMETTMLPRLQAYYEPAKLYGIWHVFDSASSTYLGWLLSRPMGFFSNTPDFNDIELGWRFLSEHWGKGYAPESTNALIAHISKHTAISCVSAIAVPENKASIRVMEKLGMEYVKTYLQKDPLFEDEVVLYSKRV